MANTLIQTIQMIGCMIPIVGIIALLYKRQNISSMYLIITNIGCLIMNIGYLLLMRSTGFKEALIAYKMQYIGSILFYVFFGLFVVSYFTKKYYRWVFYIWGVFELLPLFCLLSDKWIRLLFRSLTFETHPTFHFHYMRIIPQPLYMMRYCVIAMVLFGGMIASTIFMLRSKSDSERENIARLIGAEFVIVVSLTIKLVGNLKFDVVPIFGSFAILAIILSVIQGEFFGITNMAREWAFEQMENSMIVVDKMYGFLDANKYARDLFPLLEIYPERARVPKEIYNLFQLDDCVVEIKNRFYELKMIEMCREEKVEGYSLLLADVTQMRQLMDQLVEEKNRADEANRAKSAFMSNMSHEIRTPMNAIVGMTEILMRSDLPETEREYLGNIQRSGNALLGIINDILDFSKIESGKMQIVEDNYAPLPMLNDLKMIILNRIGSKMIQLDFDIDENLPAVVYGDELRIRQVLINVANNAVKFTEEGYVKLTVKVREIEGDHCELFFSVKDSGQGIAPEDIDKLFGAYNQVDAKKNHYKEGTGLGLAISKQFVEMMGGRISVKSKYGEGSEFYFTVPQKIVDARKAIDVKEEPRLNSENVLNFTAPQAKIMVVDDNEMNRKVALGLLAPLEMQIDTAENGKQALDMICSKKYDLIFMDHMMPVMDGIEATKRLREMDDEYCKNVPVIALTANAVVEARAKFFEAGMNDFAAKPIDLKDICAKIRHWIPAEYIIDNGSGVDCGSDGASKATASIVSIVTKEEEPLPEIQGLDVQEGIKNSGTKELFFSLLGDFYKLIDMKSIKMEKCLADGLIRDYTIEVHALKNTARMIGAMELSKWCYELEMLGNAENVDELTEQTPGMLELYRSYKEVLKPYAKLQNEEKKQAPAEVIIGSLKELRDAIDTFDLDRADEIMKQIEQYQLEEALEPLLEELRAYVADVAMEEVMDMAEKMIKMIEMIEQKQEDA